MSTRTEEPSELVERSLLYKEFLAEREEILRHKWIESEKAGHDIGFEKALLDWIVKHRSSWRTQRSSASTAQPDRIPPRSRALRWSRKGCRRSARLF